MSSFLRVPRPPKCFVPAAIVLALVGVGARPINAAEEIAVARQLPDVEVRSLATGRSAGLASALAGRPAVVLLTDGSAQPSCPIGQAAAELQHDYAPWFSWVAVMSGPLGASEIELLRTASPVRFERLYLDRGARVQAALGIGRLPALLLVDENGTVHEICSGEASTGRLDEVATTIRVLASGSRRRRAGFDDFRLPQVGRTELVSFLDVAGRETTVVAFAHSRCTTCARQLEVLDFARDRRAGSVSFVVVFLDDAPDASIRGFLAAAGVNPDFVLRDSELLLAGRYGIGAVPALLVIDANGGIVLSRGGYRDEDRDSIYLELERAFDAGAISAAAEAAVVEARRLNEEACAFLRAGKPEYALLFQERIREILPTYYSVHLRIAEAALAAGQTDLAIRSLARYLAAQPLTYDSALVRQTIAGLLAKQR